jgi:ankyrin repeat protein
VLLARGADPNDHKTNGWTAMHYAALEDSEPLVQLLYSHGALLDEKNEDGCTPLFLAAREGSASALRALINLGANPTLPMTTTRCTPLMTAAAAGKLNTFQVLLDSVAHAGHDEGDAVMWQVIAEGGNVDILERWLQQSPSIPSGKSSPCATVRHRAPDSCVFFPFAFCFCCNTEGMNNMFHRLPPLHIACARGNVDMVRALLDRQLVDPNEKDVDGCTALYHAASLGVADVVEVLLSRGASVNEGCSKRTPLHCAVGWGHTKCVELLLRCGADRSIKDSDQRTPLQLLRDMPVKRGHVEEMEALLTNDNLSVR